MLFYKGLFRFVSLLDFWGPVLMAGSNEVNINESKVPAFIYYIFNPFMGISFLLWVLGFCSYDWKFRFLLLCLVYGRFYLGFDIGYL